MRSTLKKLEEARGGMRPFIEYERDALEAFLNEAAKLIKNEARGHAEFVGAKRSGAAIWLEYKGQDRLDVDLRVVFHINPVDHKVNVAMHVEQLRNDRTTNAEYFSGEFTPDKLLDLFNLQF